MSIISWPKPKIAKGLLLAAVLLGFLAFPAMLIAKGDVDDSYDLIYKDGIRLDDYITQWSYKVILVSVVIITIFVVTSLSKGFMSEAFKKTAFLFIIIPTIGTTLYLSASTVYLNKVSSTNGPVHWHADFKIYSCGQEIDLKDPSGISNRIGTPVLHEHGDDRIHVEGVVLDQTHVSLKEFFEVIGGTMTQNTIIFPTNNGPLVVKNGDLCNSKAGQWQVFVYQTDVATNEVSQKKLPNFPDYILSPYGVIPPGDCIILEYDSEIKDKTNNICNFYQIELDKGSIKLAN